MSDYLKEEIVAEGIVRNLPSFSSFLEFAALSDASPLNYSTFARDVGVSSHSIRSYFEIMEDTMMGHHLPSYTKRPKRRVKQAPKFFFSDVGVVNFLAKRRSIERKSELYGKAFENWVYHELRLHSLYSKTFYDLSYWGGPTEVDFILNDMEVAIEAKASDNIHADHLRGLRQLAGDYPTLRRRIVVSLVDRRRRTEDGIEIVPYAEFASELWRGGLLV